MNQQQIKQNIRKILGAISYEIQPKFVWEFSIWFLSDFSQSENRAIFYTKVSTATVYSLVSKEWN